MHGSEERKTAVIKMSVCAMKRGCLDSVANYLKSPSILQEKDLLNAKNVAVSSTTGATSTIICGSILARNPLSVRSVRRTFLARPLCGIT